MSDDMRNALEELLHAQASECLPDAYRLRRFEEIGQRILDAQSRPVSGEPVAWADNQGLERPIDAEAMRMLRENPTTEAYWKRFDIPLYIAPPAPVVDRAAVIEECAKAAEDFHRWIGAADYSNAFDKAGIAAVIRALASKER